MSSLCGSGKQLKKPPVGDMPGWEASGIVRFRNRSAEIFHLGRYCVSRIGSHSQNLGYCLLGRYILAEKFSVLIKNEFLCSDLRENRASHILVKNPIQYTLAHSGGTEP